MPSACVIVPALEAARTIADVVRGLRAAVAAPIYVIDDGSTDETARLARREGAVVLRHLHNRGKGAALVTGLAAAARDGHEIALSVDADGQHPPESAAAVMSCSADSGALVLGVRDLVAEGAPRANQFGNAVSNFFLSSFAGRPLRDTQCGLRRYPVDATLSLGTRSRGFAFEAEVVLRAVARGVPVVEAPIHTIYRVADRSSHFRVVSDPARIIAAVLRTVAELRLAR